MANAPATFDAELVDELVTLFTDRHGAHFTEDEVLTMWGEMSHGHALAALKLEKQDLSSRLELAIRVELEPNDFDLPSEARDIALDALDAVFASFFESERLMRLPPVWDSHLFLTYEVKLKGEVTRPDLEALADRLLAGEGLD